MKSRSGSILFAKIRPTSLPPNRGFLQALTVFLRSLAPAYAWHRKVLVLNEGSHITALCLRPEVTLSHEGVSTLGCYDPVDTDTSEQQGNLL